MRAYEDDSHGRLCLLHHVLPRASASGSAVRVDAVFARWNSATPGCAVGVGVKGRPVLERAYGVADLEREVENAPDTIFEAGSVAKQFTAAAVLLLARDGKLSIDDPVRQYVPELSAYAVGSGETTPKANANATQYAHAVAEAYPGQTLTAPPAVAQPQGRPDVAAPRRPRRFSPRRPTSDRTRDGTSATKPTRS